MSVPLAEGTIVYVTSQSDLEETYRIYVRREGGHLIGLCAEARAIISGSTIEEIVERTKALIASGRHSLSTTFRIAVHASEAAEWKQPNAHRNGL